MRDYLKNNESEKAGSGGQMGKHLLSKCEALSSNPSKTKKQTKKLKSLKRINSLLKTQKRPGEVLHICNPSYLKG
jgi:hypothetical protein